MILANDEGVIEREVGDIINPKTTSRFNLIVVSRSEIDEMDRSLHTTWQYYCGHILRPLLTPHGKIMMGFVVNKKGVFVLPLLRE